MSRGIGIRRRESAPGDTGLPSRLKADLYSISLGLEAARKSSAKFPRKPKRCGSMFLDAEVCVKPKAKGAAVLVLCDDASIHTVHVPMPGRRVVVCAESQDGLSSDREDDTWQDFLFNGACVASIPLALSPFGAGSFASALLASPVHVACVPLVFPGEDPLALFAFDSHGRPRRAEQHALSSLSGFMAGSGLIEILLGDVNGGALQTLLAFLGLYASTERGQKHLPTYSLVAFVNGTIQTSTLAEVLPHYKGALLGAHLPAVVNVAHVCILTSPLLSFAGAYCGYRFIQVLRRSRLEVDQPSLAPAAPEFAPFVGQPYVMGTPPPSTRGSVDGATKQEGWTERDMVVEAK